jgi:hypothetical protein
MSISRMNRDAARQPSCSAKMRREGLQRTSPSCRSCCASRIIANRTGEARRRQTEGSRETMTRWGGVIDNLLTDLETETPGAEGFRVNIDHKIWEAEKIARGAPPIRLGEVSESGYREMGGCHQDNGDQNRLVVYWSGHTSQCLRRLARGSGLWVCPDRKCLGQPPCLAGLMRPIRCRSRSRNLRRESTPRGPRFRRNRQRPA